MEKNERTCARKTSSGPPIAPSALATATALLQLADEPGDGQIVAKTRTRTLRAKYTCNPLPDEAVVRLIAIVSTTQLSSTGKIPWTNIQREHFPTYTGHALRGMHSRHVQALIRSYTEAQVILDLQADVFADPTPAEHGVNHPKHQQHRRRRDCQSQSKAIWHAEKCAGSQPPMMVYVPFACSTLHCLYCSTIFCLASSL